MQRYLAILSILMLSLMVSPVFGQIPLDFTYQARLTDSTGNPVPDDMYSMEFRFFSQPQGGSPVWTKPIDEYTSNGFFDVSLEMELDNLSGPLYLEIMVDGEIMIPRAPISSVPFSAVSQRITGDIHTGEGLLRIIDPVDELVGFEASSGPGGNSIKLIDPVDELTTRVEISADSTKTSFKMIDPVDKKDAFELLTDMTGNSMRLMDPVDERSLVEISNGIDNNACIYMFNPQPEPPADGPMVEIKSLPGYGGFFALNNLTGDEVGPLIEMTADPTASSKFKIHAAQPTFSGRVEIEAQYTDGANMTLFREGLTPHNEIKAIDLRVSSDIGGEFKIFDYSADTEKEMLSISGSPSAGALIRMFNPQPEPPAIMMEMGATELGASLAMAGPGAIGPSTEITDPMFEVITDSSGGAINLYDEIGKYMGFDPTPFTPGGILYFIDPSADDTNMFLGSDGYLSAQKGNFGDNTNDSNHSLTVGTGNETNGNNSLAGGQVAFADHDNCFVWSDYPFGPSVYPVHTSADNQFIVRATGGVKFYTNAAMTTGVQLTTGSSAWTAITALNAINDVQEINGDDILNKIRQLPIKSYRIDGEKESIKHIGPMAEDFNRLFNSGGDDDHISAQDQSGVALAGVQALLDRIEQLEARIVELERRK